MTTNPIPTQIPRPRTIRTIYALLQAGEMKADKARLVREFTQGRAFSLSDLNDTELNGFMSWLKVKVSQKNAPMRAVVIRLMSEIGYVKSGQPDYARINAWLSRYTAPKKKLFYLSYKELQGVVSQVRTMHRNETAKK